MKPTSVGTGTTAGFAAFIICLGAMSVFPGVTGCTTTGGYGQTTGESAEDLATASRVRAALDADSQYKFGGIGVKSHGGKVELKGSVNSRDQKHRAEHIVLTVLGVTEVVNRITVRESAG
jgi:osmotically-inducible protein OsmY